jgi:hypothetical protein
MGYLQCLEATQKFFVFLVFYLHGTIKTSGSPQVVVSIKYGGKQHKVHLGFLVLYLYGTIKTTGSPKVVVSI